MTGAGLGRAQQGISDPLEAAGNRGRAGLGLDPTAPEGSAAGASYALQPDACLLVNDQPELTMQEMEWWRILEQRQPSKLLRSKFLPQDDILLALRTAREGACNNVPSESIAQDALPRASHAGIAESARPGLREQPASVMPPAGISEHCCTHQGTCLAPRDSEHSTAFWHMASLEVGLSLCSTAAAAAPLPPTGADTSGFSFLDLSLCDCGATQYMLTHAPVKVQSAVVMSSEATQQLRSSSQPNAAEHAGAQPVLQQWPWDFRTGKMPSPAADAAAPVSQHVQSSHSPDSALALPPLPQSEAKIVTKTRPGQAVQESPQLCSIPQEPDTAGLETPQTTGQSAEHSLESFQALTAAVGQVNLVIGSLCSQPGAAGAVHRVSRQSGEGASISARDTAYVGNTVAASGVSNPGRQPAEACSASGRHDTPLGVMEAEYGSAYRAQLLWECAVALSCLKPGRCFHHTAPKCKLFMASQDYACLASVIALCQAPTLVPAS